jgi:DNA polymerase III alpha subunit
VAIARALANAPRVLLADDRQPVRRAGVFSQYCTGKGVQPIIGCQIASPAPTTPLPPDPLVLLAQDAAGLANLQRLSSIGFLDTDPA